MMRAPDPSAGVVVAVTTDLIFATRITRTARGLDRDALVAANADVLRHYLEQRTVTIVMVDMSMPSELACEAIATAVADGSALEVIAFYSHVNRELRTAAEKAGATQVLTRSVFVERLPELISPCRQEEH